MTAPRRPAPARPDDSRSNTLGAVLIAAAVLIGFVLLLRGFDQEGGVVATGEVTATTVPEGDDDPDVTASTAPPATSPPASVSVLVANGSGAVGAAGKRQTTLGAAGYADVDTANAPTPVSQTSVYFGPGLQADAVAVAEALGLPAAVVSALPSPPPFDTRGADVVVVVGTDGA